MLIKRESMPEERKKEQVEGLLEAYSHGAHRKSSAVVADYRTNRRPLNL